MVAFRFKLVIPASSLAQTRAGDATIDLLVEGAMGIYSFVLATIRKHALREQLRTDPVVPDNGPPDILIIPAEDEGDRAM